jgi:hypothetical protein
VAGSAQYTVGASTPALIASAPAGGGTGPVGWFYFTNGSGVIYLGGSGVTSANGAQLAASTTLTGWLFPGDSIYAITASSTSAVGVLQTGA